MQQGINTVTHLTGGLVSKSERKNILGRDPLVSDKICNTVGNHPCLAGTRTRQYHHRPGCGSYGMTLHFIEII